MNNGFLRTTLVSPKFVLGKPSDNILVMLDEAKKASGDILVFPELATTGYTMDDYFYHQDLLNASDNAIATFLSKNPFKGVVVIGAPFVWENIIYNCAIVIQKDRILGIVPKMYLPHTSEFYESRWFQDGEGVQTITTFLGQNVPFGIIVFKSEEYSFAVEVCADMWGPVNPSSNLYLAGAEVVVNISASPEVVDKFNMRRTLANSISYRHKGAYLYVSSNANESSTSVVFSGDTFVSQMGTVIAEDKEIGFETKVVHADVDVQYLQHVRRSNGWYRQARKRTPLQYETVAFTANNHSFELLAPLDETPFIPKSNQNSTFDQIRNLQSISLLRRLQVLPKPKVVLGLSGGLDSTLALLVCVDAFKKQGFPLTDIYAYILPSKHSSQTTQSNARALAKGLGVSFEEQSIQDKVDSELKSLDHTTIDTTYENVQARMRTLFLMNKANQVGGLVIGTSDMSEIALGFSTYAGDQTAHYGVNAGLPKTLVRFMVEQFIDVYPALQEVLTSVVQTPISPELRDAQVSESIIGSFEINDLILYRFLKFGDGVDRLTKLFPKYEQQIKDFFTTFNRSQFKRATMPNAAKILFSGLSPMADLRLPSDLL